MMRADGSQIAKGDGSHPSTKVFKTIEEATNYIMEYVDIIRKATSDFYVDQGDGHDHEHIHDSKDEILTLHKYIDPKDHLSKLHNNYIQEIDVQMDRTKAVEGHYDLKEEN